MRTAIAPAAPPDGMTVADFQRWVDLPANRGRWWELDRGRLIEVPPPKSPQGALCSWISYLLWAYAITRGRGRVTSNDTGLIVHLSVRDLFTFPGQLPPPAKD